MNDILSAVLSGMVFVLVQNNMNNMSGQRKIVVILGNGFDLDLGLKTSYKDFWESEYCPKNYPAPLIRHLNQCWPGNLESVRWYDLENELLTYYRNLQDVNSPKDILPDKDMELLHVMRKREVFSPETQEEVDLIKRLIDLGILYRLAHDRRLHADYLEDLIALSPIERDKKALSLIKERLCKYLETAVKDYRYESIAYCTIVLLADLAYRGIPVEFYSFNYTSLEQRGIGIDDSRVNYIHGSCKDNDIIVGTRDDANINNNYLFLQKTFDHHYRSTKIVPDLLQAKEVIIFGHSLGENDSQYFKAFFKQQTDPSRPSPKDITIFTKDEESAIQIKSSIQQMTDGNLAALYSLNSVSIIKTSELEKDRVPFTRFLDKCIPDNSIAKEIVDKLIEKQSTQN